MNDRMVLSRLGAIGDEPMRFYVAGPIRPRDTKGNRVEGPEGRYRLAQNIERAERLAAWIFDQGHAAICVHTVSRYLEAEAPPEQWLDADLALLRLCDAVLLAPGWESSEGTQLEVRAAEACGMMVLEPRHLVDAFDWAAPDLRTPWADTMRFVFEQIATATSGVLQSEVA